MSIAIETAGLTRDFGKFRAVNELNLRVESGRFYGFLGPNGAGKSTTIKMLTGLLAPTAGAMRILSEDLSDPRRAIEVKRRIGVVPENLALFDNLTAREHLTFVGRMYLLPPVIGSPGSEIRGCVSSERWSVRTIGAMPLESIWIEGPSASPDTPASH